MSTITEFKNMLIPAIKAFCNVPIIGADQLGDRPEGAHATFKITSPFIKGIGQAEEMGEFGATSYQLRRVEQFKRVLSFTAYDMDEDVSHELAQQIHDWFDFHGYDFLSQNNIVVMEQSAVSNRDAFVMDDYERRNGFDVTLRMTREMIQQFEYIERVDVFEDEMIDYNYLMDADFEFDPNGVVNQDYADTPIDAVVNYQIGHQSLLMAGSAKAGQTVI